MGKILGIIPARRGSTRLPGKNTKLLCGKPMISYAIEEALKSEYLSDIVVTTDDEKVKEIAGLYPLRLIDRPEKLARDDTPMVPVIRHVLDTPYTSLFDVVVLLQPTAPLRTKEHIDKCIRVFQNGGFSAVISVHETPHPSVSFIPNGAVFIYSTKVLSKIDSLFDRTVLSKACLVAMPQECSVDVDTEVDFLFAEAILNEQNK